MAVCDAMHAEDHTADANVDISFPGNGPSFAYAPNCIKIKAGNSVTFKGDFMAHKLAGGSNPPTPDPNSPIKETGSGMSAQFKFPTAGTFPYFCEYHYLGGMKGTIFVE